MKKTLLLFLMLCNWVALFSQEKIKNPTYKQTQKGYFSVDYLSVKMPNDFSGNPEINMGLSGIHYNLWLSNSFYGGLGFYGSVLGERGGLFTLGLNLGYKKNLTDQLFIDTGFHFGGGGGDGAPDGGGAFILPHFNFGYQFKNVAAFAGYSAINFFDKGNINSQQVHVGIQIPVSLHHVSFQSKELRYTPDELKSTDWNQISNRISLFFHLNNLSPYGASKFTNGSSLKGNTIRLAGFEISAALPNNWFAFLKLDGAYDGIKAGYMDIFLGGGHHFSFNNNNTNILTKFSVGAGGGGGVETEGGFLIHPDISIEQRLFNSVYISVNKGYLLSPNANFKAATFGIGLKYNVNKDGILDKNNQRYRALKFKGVQFSLSQEVYFDAQRGSNPSQHVHQISLQANLFLNNYVYVAGQTSFANFGNAGAYAEGIVGIGLYSKTLLNDNVNFFAQLLAGAAGGGDISTGEGLIVKPSIGFNYNLNDALSIRTSVGKVNAKEGKLNSTSVAFGLSYNISFLTAN